MNILQVITSAYPQGAEHHVLHLSQLLQQEGHNVQVICPLGWLSEQLINANISIHLWDQQKPTFSKDCALFKKVMRQKFDIIHSHLTRGTYMSLYASWRYKVPLVSTVHVNWIDPVYIWASRIGHSLISVSEYNRQILLKKKVSSKRVFLIPHSLFNWPSDQFNRVDFLKNHQLSESAFFILIAATLKPIKGHLLALEALALLVKTHPNVHLLCIGREEPETLFFLKNKVQEFKITDHVHFMGFQDNVLEWMQSVQVLWVPSETESFCLAAAESLACGAPVIAADVGALSEIIDHGNTGYVISRDPQIFAQTTAELIEKPKLLQIMKQKSLQTAQQRFAAEIMIKKIETLYTLKAKKKFSC